MSRVAVIGGGRWARVLASVASELLAEDERLSLHTPRGYEATSAWVAARADQRIEVERDWPVRRPTAVIVANAARDHVAAVSRALEEGVPVLVEKPMAIGARDAHRLVELAAARGTTLATAHVFLYASYLDELRRLVQAHGGARNIRIAWADPTVELRYGEAKTYDKTLNVIEDVLPHAHSIVFAITQRLARSAGCATLSDEGGRAQLELRVDDARVGVRLAREADARARVIDVEVDDATVRLDFTEEPGNLSLNGVPVAQRAPYARNPGPVARMLAAFLEAARGGPFDPRLDPMIGVRACELTDQALGR